MGCDIHAMIEKRHIEFFDSVEGDRSWCWWENAGDPGLPRNYYIFYRLAGVRGSGDCIPISDPRGFPKDACSAMHAWIESYGEDGHSHSWLTRRELKEHGVGVENPLPWIADAWNTMMKRMEAVVGNDEDVRLVFFFDN